MPPQVLDDIQIKALDGQFNVDEAKGIVECFVAAIGNKDSVGDIILPGAFNQSLKRRWPRVVWGHDWNQPIGKVLEIYEVGPDDPRLPIKMKANRVGGLYCKMQFNLKSERGREAFASVAFFGTDQEFCVTPDTEILTTRGWLTHDQVTTDDQAYVIDPETLQGRFEPILAVNVWPEKTRTLREIQVGNFSSMSTLNHRWLVRQGKGNGCEVQWRTSEELDYRSGIIRAAQREDAPVAKWDDAFVEIVAWYWTEGWRTTNGHSDKAAYIGQSHEKNPVHTANIRSALNKVFPLGFTEQGKANGMTFFRLRQDPTEALVAVTDERKAPTMEFLLSLTVPQLRLFIQRCIDGDGTNGNRWAQTDKESIRRFEVACALAGLPTHSYTAKSKDGSPYAPISLVHLLKSNYAKPLDSIRVASYGYKGEREQPAVDRLVEHTGIVWCPTTPSGTWLARRDGTVYFTGNSIGYKTLDADYDHSRQANLLKVVELYEVSPVLHGANQLTAAISIKDGKAAPPDAIPQENFTGDVMRGYGPRRGNLERLLRYWRPIMKKPGGFRRCLVILADHPELYPLQRICAWLHHETTGLWPNEGCHHPGMKNCRNKLRGVRNGSIWTDSEFGDRLDRIPDGKSLDEDGDVTDDDVVFANAVLKQFMGSEPEFVKYLADDKNWMHVGDDDDDVEIEHDWVKGDKGCGCGGKSAEDDFEFKTGRVLSNANLAKISQAIDLLQQVVSSGARMEQKEKMLVLVDPDRMFEAKELLDPVAEYYGVEIGIDEKSGRWLSVPADSPDLVYAVKSVFHDQAIYGLEIAQ